MKDDLPWEEQTSQMGCGLGALIHPSAVKLSKYIGRQHSGDRTAFAKSQGVGLTQVRRWLEMDCMVIDGEVWRRVAKNKLRNK